jgi:protein-S-isoprenylcysteine O-methyltransferase Ste14
MAARIRRWLFGCGLIAAILFGFSGRWRDPWLWAYCATWAGILLFPMFAMDEELARERYHPPTGGADRVALVAIRLVAVGHLIVAALDGGRWHVTHISPALRLLGFAGLVACGLLVFRAMLANRFFSAVVRIQSDRGHHVIESGPYAVVRHPGYAGMIPLMAMSGLALSSWLAFGVGLVYAALVIRRVLLEDGFLHANLGGYREYAGRVRHRLIPHVF